MNNDMIRDEIAQFNDNFFAHILDIIDENFDFIDANDLIEPKANYLLIFDFLNTTINHFSNLDHDFMDGTLKKLHRDVNNIYKIYQKHKLQQEKLEELFKTEFLNKSKLFNQMKSNIIEIRGLPSMDEVDRETVEIIKDHYRAMRTIYFDFFQEDYTEQSKEILSSLENILNCKIFYLDNLLWIEAPESETIWRSLKILRIDQDIDSKKYLEYRIKVALPYTKDYAYMLKCLRIYK